MERIRRQCFAALCAALLTVMPLATAFAEDGGGQAGKTLAKIQHFVVIYQENHSFDNLYGGWEGVRGLADADAAHTAQLSQGGQLYDCLRQDDVNLASPPLGVRCTATHGGAVSSAFVNVPF